MTNEKMQDEIAWMKQLAEEGRDAPLTGGNILIWWGTLSFVMLLIHWASLTEKLPLPIQFIGFGWMIYAALGVFGTIVLARKANSKPGASAIGNRVSGAAWQMVMAGIFTFVAGCVLAVSLADTPLWIFNAILPVSFICYGIAHGVTAKLTQNRPIGFVATGSFAAALIMTSLLTNPIIYLLAAVSILIVTVLPALISAKSSR